jgi:hypothetical protein
MAVVETLLPAAPETPARSREQRLSALEHANRIRLYRASVKRALISRELDIVTILSGSAYEDALLTTMKVRDLLGSVPRLGDVRVEAVMRKVKIARGKTIGGLSVRQREELWLEMNRVMTGGKIPTGPRPGSLPNANGTITVEKINDDIVFTMRWRSGAMASSSLTRRAALKFADSIAQLGEEA